MARIIRMIEHVASTGGRWMAVGCGDGSPTAPTPHPPTVTVSCDPCQVTFGARSRLRADVSDPDGGPPTYRWTGVCRGHGSQPGGDVVGCAKRIIRFDQLASCW